MIPVLKCIKAISKLGMEEKDGGVEWSVWGY